MWTIKCGETVFCRFLSRNCTARGGHCCGLPIGGSTAGTENRVRAVGRDRNSGTTGPGYRPTTWTRRGYSVRKSQPSSVTTTESPMRPPSLPSTEMPPSTAKVMPG